MKNVEVGMFKTALCVFVVLLLSAGAMSADFYKWEDEEGNLHITDYPPPKKGAKKVKVHQTESEAVDALPRMPQNVVPLPPAAREPEAVKPGTSHEVVLYTTSWCPYCKQAKAYFDAKSIPYTEYDVEKDSAAAARRAKMSGSGVPFAVVNGERISGYSPSAYDAALRKNE